MVILKDQFPGSITLVFHVLLTRLIDVSPGSFKDPVFLEEGPADQLICNGRIVTKFRKLLL